MTDITNVRQAFDEKLAEWAREHGYKRRGYLWVNDQDYLTSRINPEQNGFIAERRTFRGGKLIADIDLGKGRGS